MRSKRGIAPAVWVIGSSVAFACSLTAPEKDELFRPEGGGSGGDASGGTSSGSGGKAGGAGTSAVEGGAAGEGGGGGAFAGEAGAGGVTAGAMNAGAGQGGAPEPGAGGAGGEGGAIFYPPFEPAEGLLARYAFEETEGTVAVDAVAGLDATVNGTVTRVTGKIGGALRLSGSAAYVDVPVSTLAALDEVTFAVWFNPATQTLWTRVLDVGSSVMHWMYFSPAAAPAGQGTGTHLALDVANQITAEMHVSTFTPPVQMWTHVAITWSRENFAYYINGELAASDDTPLFTPAEFVSLTPGGETLRAWLGRSSFAADAYFTGALDDFRIYDHALPPPHVAALHELAE